MARATRLTFFSISHASIAHTTEYTVLAKKLETVRLFNRRLCIGLIWIQGSYRRNFFPAHQSIGLAKLRIDFVSTEFFLSYNGMAQFINTLPSVKPHRARKGRDYSIGQRRNHRADFLQRRISFFLLLPLATSRQRHATA
jgi:hypothetical protein